MAARASGGRDDIATDREIGTVFGFLFFGEDDLERRDAFFLTFSFREDSRRSCRRSIQSDSRSKRGTAQGSGRGDSRSKGEFLGNERHAHKT